MLVLKRSAATPSAVLKSEHVASCLTHFKHGLIEYSILIGCRVSIKN